MHTLSVKSGKRSLHNRTLFFSSKITETTESLYDYISGSDFTVVDSFLELIDVVELFCGFFRLFDDATKNYTLSE
jgi:hypothetical protein